MTAMNTAALTWQKIRPQLKRYLIPGTIGVVVLALWFGLNQGALYAVEVDGAVIGYVRDPKGMQAVANSLLEEKSALLGQKVTAGDSLQLRRVDSEGRSASAPAELREPLARALPLAAAGYIIKVNGQPVVGVATQAEGEAVVAGLEGSYGGESTDSQATVVEEVRIAENIEISPAAVPLPLLKTPEEAKNYLLTGTSETKVYKVAEGDTLWTIARANSLTVDELTAANPGINPNRLKLGQELNMVVPKPYVNVASREKVTVTESIPYKEEVQKDDSIWMWERQVKQKGAAGQKEVVYTVERMNGKLVDKQVSSERVIKEPVRQVVLQGTRRDTAVIAMGSGKFLWPADGQISSTFGTRSVSRGSSSHTGVDIAAARGTPVRAADDGVVTKAGWSGNYGNLVIINHGNGYSTYYAHNQSIAVKVGDKVTRGQIISLVGSTGRSTGPHCHFEIRYNDKPLNPMNYFK